MLRFTEVQKMGEFRMDKTFSMDAANKKNMNLKLVLLIDILGDKKSWLF